MKKNQHFSPNARSFPTMRQMLRYSRRGGKFRAPWYSGFPNRNHAGWVQSLKRK